MKKFMKKQQKKADEEKFVDRERKLIDNFLVDSAISPLPKKVFHFVCRGKRRRKNERIFY